MENETLNSVIQNLTEYYNELRDEAFVQKIKDQSKDLFVDTGNQQNDYETFRDKVEKVINKFIA